MKRLSILSLIIILLSLGFIFLGYRLGKTDQSSGDTAPSIEIDRSQIAAHSTMANCWAAIGGSVYLLDNYFSKNPDQILANQLCGKIEPNVALPNNLKNKNLYAYRIGILAP
jgi:hypothetical protein